MTRTEQVQQELESLRDAQGLIVPEAAVAWAKDHPDSELYKRLEWDNEKAGHQWRLQQVRNLIRVVFVDPEGGRIEHSLKIDRSRPGGGYRALDAVLASPTFTEELLAEFAQRLAYIVAQYRRLRELAGVDPTTLTVLSSMEEYVLSRRRPPPDADDGDDVKRRA